MITVPIVKRVAIRANILDQPGRRKIHTEQIPLLGGISICTGFFLTVVSGLVVLVLLNKYTDIGLQYPFIDVWLTRLLKIWPKLTAVLLGAASIALLGLIDDVRKDWMDYRTKFPLQFLIATGVVLAGVRTDFMPANWLNVVISVIWIVGIINAFNLLDNMDGLTAGVAAISGAIFLVIMMMQGQHYMAFLLAAVVGPSLGFLIFNFNPAGIFMGDSGSLFLGFLFGTSTILASYVTVNSPTMSPVVMPIVILSFPIYDTLSVIIIRWREKRPIFIGDKRHFSHRLVEFGMSEKKAVVFIYLVTALVASTGVLLPYLEWSGCLLILAQVAVIYTLITILMIKKKGNNL